MKMKILSVCHHPGSANSIIPIIRILNKKHRVISIAYEVSKEIFNKNKLKFTTLEDFNFKKPSIKAAIKIINKIKPNLIFVGNSQEYSIENYFVYAARRLKIKTIGILDLFRINYYSTFYIKKSNKSIPAIPSKLLVINKNVKRKLEKVGVKGRNIIASGVPNFDYLKKLRSVNKKIINRMKERLNIPKGKKIILWLSQPIEDDANVRRDYTEKTALLDLIGVLKNAKIKNTSLFVRLHPREKGTKIKKIINNEKQIYIRLISNNIHLSDSILISDIIISMESTVLYESALIGKTVISYHPTNKAKNILTQATDTKIFFTKTKKGLKRQIMRSLIDKKKPKPKKIVPIAPKIAKIIEKQLHKS